ncbi:MAG: hypothetical protein AB2L14_04920 [Candidatus Xenobiia bacterium LiM19]
MGTFVPEFLTDKVKKQKVFHHLVQALLAFSKLTVDDEIPSSIHEDVSQANQLLNELRTREVIAL